MPWDEMEEQEGQDPGETSPEGSQNPEEDNPDPSDSTERNSQTDGLEPEGQEETRGVEWKLAKLKGKTPEEVEAYIATLESANREMNTNLNTLSSRIQQEETREPERDPVDDEYENTRFYDDPDKKLDLFQKRVDASLERTIAPFKENLKKAEVAGVRERLRNEYDDFELYEPVINSLVAQQGRDPQSVPETELRQLYFTAVGYATRNGIDLRQDRSRESAESKETPTREEPEVVNPPNRRPSGAPPPPPKGKKPQRELTETERRLAREWNMTPEEYLEAQELDQSEVVKPGFSVGEEGW